MNTQRLIVRYSLLALATIMFCANGAFAQNSDGQTSDTHKFNFNEEEALLHAYQQNDNYESSVLSIIKSIQTGKLNVALSLANSHIEKFPKSRVGHLLKADVLYALTSPLSQPGSGLTAEQSVALDGLTHQLKNRWLHAEHEGGKTHTYLPSSLLSIGQHKHVIVADMGSGRLYLYANDGGRPKLIRDYYLTVGSDGFGKQVEGDNKTPVGVYSIYRYIKGSKLPDLYGGGAFPVNYPNRFDRYHKRTGYGIWLHGTPSDTYARSPWASEGCFVLSNDDLNDISQYISVEERTPVILSDSIDWVSLSELTEARQQAMSVIDNWKADWESLNTNAYLSHYSQDNFNFGRANFQRWATRKKDTNSRKTFIQLDIELQSLFMYPGETDMFVVQYTQRYISNNFSGESQKEQYWKRNDSGQWQIIFEG